MKIEFSAAARRDRREAEAWYAQSPAALLQFSRDLRAALRYISDYPQGSPVFKGPTLAKTLTRYPYTILYRITGNSVFVAGIVDERRKPGTYDDRLI